MLLVTEISHSETDIVWDRLMNYSLMLRQKVITDWVSTIVSYILTLPLSHYAD